MGELSNPFYLKDVEEKTVIALNCCIPHLESPVTEHSPSPSPTSGHPATENINIMVIGLSVGLSLGILLIAAALIVTMVMTILCIQISRKKNSSSK